MVCRRDYRIVQRSSATSFDFLQGFLEPIDVGSKILIKIVLIIKIDDEYLILWITGSHQIQRRLVYLLPLFPHGARVIDDDRHRHRNIFVTKRRDGLRFAIFKDRKRALLQIRDHVLLVVQHGGVQHDFFDFFLKNKDAVVVAFRLLPRFSTWLSLLRGSLGRSLLLWPGPWLSRCRSFGWLLSRRRLLLTCPGAVWSWIGRLAGSRPLRRAARRRRCPRLSWCLGRNAEYEGKQAY